MAIRIIKVGLTDREASVVDALGAVADVSAICKTILLAEAAGRGIEPKETAVEKASRLLDEGKEKEASDALLEALKASRAKKGSGGEKKESSPS
jgi:hypothetical protein